MAFEAKKFEDIYREMTDRSNTVTDFSVGSVARTMYESFAFELGLLYEKLYRVYLAGYVDSAEGMHLEQVVAVLGIKRGLPDYAEGVVRFTRDAGNQDILIPLGTLVSTEEKPETPKKVFKTIDETKISAETQTVDIKIQAVNRGEDQAVPKETIVVMPRPIPGIKSVINPEAVLFQGKKQETDADLRQRAKNALISSGKASKVAIENTLLSLDKVRDVVVKENFEEQTGRAVFKGQAGTVVPKGTKLIVTLKSGEQKTFITTQTIRLSESKRLSPIRSADIAGHYLFPAGGLIQNHVDFIEQISLAPGQKTIPGLEILPSKEAVTTEYGIIDVFIDGLDMNDPDNKKNLNNEIDKVRSAGIYVRFQKVSERIINGFFKITTKPSLNLTDEETIALENKVQEEISRFIYNLKIQENLLFSKLIKQILSIDGVEDLADFQIKIDGDPKIYSLTDKQINAEENERLTPGSICAGTGSRNFLELEGSLTLGSLECINEAARICANIGKFLNDSAFSASELLEISFINIQESYDTCIDSIDIKNAKLNGVANQERLTDSGIKIKTGDRITLNMQLI